MKTLHTIMPMAGEGSRFLEQGYTTPKPLIQVEGIPIFCRAIAGLRTIDAHRKYSFIVRNEHIRKFNIDHYIRHFYPTANVIGVEKTTRGAVETCLLAEKFIAEDDAVIVQDCDLEFFSTSFNQGITADLQNSGTCPISGRLISFTANHPRYSYAEIDAQNRVVRTAEKKVISPHALAGAYYFSNSGELLSAAHELIRRYEDENFACKELYLSLLYNILLERNCHIQLHELEHYRSFGTPEELKGVDWNSELPNV